MALPRAHEDREYQNFVEVSGTPHRRVTGTVSGTFTPGGLSVAGKFTEVTIDNVSWTPLPATALANRNAMAIQNYSGQQVKLNFDNTVPGYTGVILNTNAERGYDIKDTVLIYAKSQTSACTLFVEELS